MLLKPEQRSRQSGDSAGAGDRKLSGPRLFPEEKELWSEVLPRYDSLASEFDCIVLEGAGSPGEINLKGSDIVICGWRSMPDPPVLLAGGYRPRAGFYASFLGTYANWTDWERELLFGFLGEQIPRGSESARRCAWIFSGHDREPVLGVIDPSS